MLIIALLISRWDVTSGRKQVTTTEMYFCIRRERSSAQIARLYEKKKKNDLHIIPYLNYLNKR